MFLEILNKQFQSLVSTPAMFQAYIIVNPGGYIWKLFAPIHTNWGTHILQQNGLIPYVYLKHSPGLDLSVQHL